VLAELYRKISTEPISVAPPTQSNTLSLPVRTNETDIHIQQRQQRQPCQSSFLIRQQVPISTKHVRSVLRVGGSTRSRERRSVRFLSPPDSTDRHGREGVVAAPENSSCVGEEVARCSAGQRSQLYPAVVAPPNFGNHGPRPVVQSTVKSPVHRKQYSAGTNQGADGPLSVATQRPVRRMNIETRRQPLSAPIETNQSTESDPTRLRPRDGYGCRKQRGALQMATYPLTPAWGGHMLHNAKETFLVKSGGRPSPVGIGRPGLLPNGGLRSSSLAGLTSRVTVQGIWDFAILAPSTFVNNQERVPDSIGFTPTKPRDITISFAYPKTMLRLLFDREDAVREPQLNKGRAP
jgi:hypothetical protein